MHCWASVFSSNFDLFQRSSTGHPRCSLVPLPVDPLQLPCCTWEQNSFVQIHVHTVRRRRIQGRTHPDSASSWHHLQWWDYTTTATDVRTVWHLEHGLITAAWPDPRQQHCVDHYSAEDTNKIQEINAIRVEFHFLQCMKGRKYKISTPLSFNTLTHTWLRKFTWRCSIEKIWESCFCR